MKIYLLKIEDLLDEVLEQLLKNVNEEKRQKLNKFRFKADKLRSLMGELLLRKVLKEEWGIEEPIFEKGEYGKPYLSKAPHCFFNISHSGEYVTVVVSEAEVGIDIEEKKIADHEKLAKRFFTAKECAYINQDSASRFYEIWSLKESYIKCVGKGLALSLKSFSFQMEEEIKLEEEPFYFKLISAVPNYALAVCRESPIHSVELIQVEMDQVIDYYLK